TLHSVPQGLRAGTRLLERVSPHVRCGSHAREGTAMAGERKDDRRRRKFLLIGFVGVAMMAVLGFGTFATFNAQVGNPSNTFASGTIVLNDTVPGGVPCLSTGGGTTA